MAFSETSGTATIGATEWSLVNNAAGPVSSTTEAIVQPIIDFFNLQAGDLYGFSIYEKATAGSTQRRLAYAEIGHPQTELFVFPPVHLKHGWDVTLQLISGTARSIAWSLRLVT